MDEVEDWRALAACRDHADPDLWSPPGHPRSVGYQRQARAARRVCAECPVRDECLSWALESGEDRGVWGGLDPVERRAERLAVRHNRAA